MRHFGGRLKDFRRKRKLTQQALADRLGVSRGTVIRWERGGDIPSARTVCYIADLLDVNVMFLCGVWDDPLRGMQLTNEERELIELYRALRPAERPMLLSAARDVGQVGQAIKRALKAS